MKKKTPFFAVSNSELSGLPSAEEGEMVSHKLCGGKHKLKANGRLFYFKCKGKDYLAGIDGKLLTNFGINKL